MIDVSIKTIRKALNDRGWYSCRLLKKIYNFNAHKTARLRAYYKVYKF